VPEGLLMNCVHGVSLMEECDGCEIMALYGDDDLDLFEDDGEEQPGLDDYCYMGHAWCYDIHYAERRADEADMEADRDGLF
jgi:hypothetical protein